MQCTAVCTKEEIAERMAAEFQGDLTHASILQVHDRSDELAGDETALAVPGIWTDVIHVYLVVKLVGHSVKCQK